MDMAYRHPTPEEKEQYVRQLFDQIAHSYDAINHVMSVGQWRRWHREFVQHTGLRPGMQSLDVACGTGDLSLLTAAQVVPGGKVVGVDFSTGMLEVGRRRVSQSPYRDVITLQWGNAMDLQFPDNTFDCVTMGWAMRNVRDIPRTVSEAYRVLKPGGRYVNLEAARPRNPLSRAMLFLWWKTLLPLIDLLVVRAGRNAPVRPYTYLSHSLQGYPAPDRLEAIFRAAGFQQTGYVPLMLGSVCIHYGVKPSGV